MMDFNSLGKWPFFNSLLSWSRFKRYRKPVSTNY